MRDSLILGCDVGGTKVNVALYSQEAGLFHPLAEASYVSASYQNLESILDDFLAGAGSRVTRAGIAVAGPVIDNCSKITKLPWIVDAGALQERFSFTDLALVNDLVATSYGILQLPDDQLVPLAEGRERSGEAKAVLAPGTGLGEAFLLWDGSSYQAHPSEGGHVNFSPVDQQQIALLQYLLQTRKFVSFDTLCSGEGLALIYAFLKMNDQDPACQAVDAVLAEAADPPAVISSRALAEEPCGVCSKALALYVRLLAAEAGNLALKVLATGGVYLGGGISPKILPALKTGFMESFIGQGPMRDLLSSIPVRVVLNQKTALLGAASLVL